MQSVIDQINHLVRWRLKKRLTPRYFLRRPVDPEHKVRVCHLVSDLEVGEVASEVVHISNGLDPDDYLVGVLCLGRRGYPAQRVEPRVQVWALHDQGPARPRTVWEAARELREYGIHVLHTHGWDALMVGAAAAKVAGIPHLIHSQYRLPPDGEPGRLERYAASLAAGTAEQWVVNTEVVAAGLAARLGLAEDRPCLVPRAVNTDLFRPPLDRGALRHNLGYDRGQVVLGTVGPLRQDKQVEWLLEAAAELLADGAQVRVLLVGSGPEEAALKRRAEELGLSGRYQLTGFAGDLPAMLTAMDIYVQTASDEGVQVATLEAMSAGLPVLAADQGAVGEMIRDGETGLLFRAGGGKELANRLRPLLEQPDRWMELGNNARRAVERRHQVNDVVARYWELYRGMLGK